MDQPRTKLAVIVARITIVIVVFAGGNCPLLIAQSTASVAIHATVLPSQQLAAPSVTTDVLKSEGRDAAPRFAESRVVFDGWSGATSPTFGRWALARTFQRRAGAPNDDGRPEFSPTVRITIAYTAN